MTIREEGLEEGSFVGDLPSEVIVAAATDVVRYEYETRDFLAGAMDEAGYRSLRAAHGTYEQREGGSFVVRGRVIAGTLRARQALLVARAAEEVGAREIHLTTRQDIQLHGVPETRVPDAMRRLLAAGLPTACAGGNTVRNVTVCPLAGVCPREVFDVTPVARHLGLALLGAGVSTYPRKFKIAVSGCGCDCALAGAADFGLVARARGASPGFSVHIGGGLGHASRRAELADEFLPVQETLAAARALLAVFDRHGDRANRARARLRFVLDRLGPEAVLREYRKEREAIPVSWTGPVPRVVLDEKDRCAQDRSGVPVPPWQWQANGEGGCRFTLQRQAGLAAVPVHPPLGVLSADELAGLAGVAERFGERGSMRLTAGQGLLILDVRPSNFPELAAALEQVRPGFARAAHLDHAVSCPGRAGCRMGLCDARAAARRIADALTAAGVPVTALDGMDLCVNGCANACGLAPVGSIGLTGVAMKEGERTGRGYRLTLGGRRGSGAVRLGASLGVYPEDRVAAVVVELVQDYLASRRGEERFGEFVAREGFDRWRARAFEAA